MALELRGGQAWLCWSALASLDRKRVLGRAPEEAGLQPTEEMGAPGRLEPEERKPEAEEEWPEKRQIRIALEDFCREALILGGLEGGASGLSSPRAAPVRVRGAGFGRFESWRVEIEARLEDPLALERAGAAAQGRLAGRSGEGLELELLAALLFFEGARKALGEERGFALQPERRAEGPEGTSLREAQSAVEALSLGGEAPGALSRRGGSRGI